MRRVKHDTSLWTEKRWALERIRDAAYKHADTKRELEAAIQEAWKMRLPNLSIAIMAGWTSDAAVRMLARRKGWIRDAEG